LAQVIFFGSVILGKKQVQTGLARGFFSLARFFSDLARFFFCFGLIQFFRFQAYKIKTKPVSFFKILIYLIGFFLRFNFFGFFSGFLGFLVFLLIPKMVIFSI